MNKIRKGDEVVILTGRDKKRRGTVLDRVDADHVLVEGINMVKKHVRPNPMQGTTGGIIEKTMPIHISNGALFNPATGKGDRVGIKEVDGRNVRVFRSSGEPVGANEDYLRHKPHRYPYLMADPACPHLAPWSPAQEKP